MSKNFEWFFFITSLIMAFVFSAIYLIHYDASMALSAVFMYILAHTWSDQAKLIFNRDVCQWIVALFGIIGFGSFIFSIFGIIPVSFPNYVLSIVGITILAKNNEVF